LVAPLDFAPDSLINNEVAEDDVDGPALPMEWAIYQEDWSNAQINVDVNGSSATA